MSLRSVMLTNSDRDRQLIENQIDIYHCKKIAEKTSYDLQDVNERQLSMKIFQDILGTNFIVILSINLIFLAQ